MVKILISILSIILAAMSTVGANLALLGYEDGAPRMFSGWTTWRGHAVVFEGSLRQLDSVWGKDVTMPGNSYPQFVIENISPVSGNSKIGFLTIYRLLRYQW